MWGLSFITLFLYVNQEDVLGMNQSSGKYLTMKLDDGILRIGIEHLTGGLNL